MINPVRHFVTISRAILMKGAGPAEIAQPFLIFAWHRRRRAFTGTAVPHEARGVEYAP